MVGWALWWRPKSFPFEKSVFIGRSFAFNACLFDFTVEFHLFESLTSVVSKSIVRCIPSFQNPSMSHAAARPSFRLHQRVLHVRRFKIHHPLS
ncbi:hypothetical protein Csa_021660 [Cucumis sativus]|nr:hypothetical protein Csa_021660 [Cucumis sativus]